MGHKFHIKDKGKLDNLRRRAYLPPKETLMEMGLQEGDVMADIGCGIGYFTLPASEIVGQGGKVYALDISREMLEEVEERLKEGKISNVQGMLVAEDHLVLPDRSVSYAFLCNVLHEVGDQDAYLDEVSRILKDGGKMGIIEWEKKEGEMGPPVAHRIDKTEVETLLKRKGYKGISIGNITPDIYRIVAVKE